MIWLKGLVVVAATVAFGIVVCLIMAAASVRRDNRKHGRRS